MRSFQILNVLQTKQNFETARRQNEEAFAFIQAINHVSDDNPDGEPEEARRVKTFFRIFYGIKQFDKNGAEQSCTVRDVELLYPSIDEARPIQMKFFDKVVEDMRRHPDEQRNFEQAFCYLQAVSHVSDTNPQGIDVYESLNKQAKERLNGSRLVFNGCDFLS